MITDQEKVFDYTKQYIFSEIFNYSCISLKNNIKLTLINNGRPIRGSIYSNLVISEMPDNSDFYYLYLCSNMHLSGLLENNFDWIQVSELMNSDHLGIDVLSYDHLTLPKSMIYAKVIRDSKILIAIPKQVIQKVDVAVESPYMVLNVDTDTPNDRVVINHEPNINENFNSIVTALNDVGNAGKMLGFINGYNYPSHHITTVANPDDDFVELNIDNNVVFDLEVPLNNRHTYNSTEEDLYKDIILLPRSFTSDLVFSYDTITVVVRDSTGKGIVLPFIDDHSVAQLTHNSIGISSYLIDAALDTLGVTTGTLYIQVGDYSKMNHHHLNGQMTKALYTEDDTFVLKALLNEHYPPIVPWTADRMESSQYAKIIGSMLPIDHFNTDAIKNQIKILGYYNYVNLICKHTGSIEHGNSIEHLSIPKGIYWQNESVYPILYKGGLKIKSSLYSVVSQSEDMVTVEFENPLAISAIESLDYTLMRDEDYFMYHYTPSAAERTLYIDNSKGEFKVYKELEVSSLKDLRMVNTIVKQEIDIQSNSWFTTTDMGDQTLLYFQPDSYGENIVVTHLSGTAINHKWDLDLSLGISLGFLPTTRVEYDGVNEGILIEADYEVFLNGRFLVKDLDYQVAKTEDAHYLKGYEIILQNINYLNDSTPNNIEIYMTGQTVRTMDVGYVVDSRIPISVDNDIWIDGVSRLYVNGLLIPFDKVTRHNDYYDLDETLAANGNVYCHIVTVDSNLVDEYQDHEDTNHAADRHSITSHFIHNYNYLNSDPVIVPNSNRFYSVYLNELIRKIINDEIVVEYINDDAGVLAQVTSYDYLKQYDMFFKPNSLNLNFCDMYPTYIADLQDTLEIGDLNHFLFINRLVEAIIGTDNINDSKIVYAHVED